MLAALLGLLTTAAFAQTNTTAATTPAKDTTTYAYQKNPKLPAFRLMMMDSTTIFNTYNIPAGRPTLFIYFGPECEHCARFTESMLKSIDSLKGFQIYMFTFANVTPLKTFYEKYHLSQYKNITMGRDYEFFFPSFYGARFVPYIVVYDKKKKFAGKWEGTATVSDIYKAGMQK